jgi:16S rRNA (cytidine1402-2'-O)-methyltransferase
VDISYPLPKLRVKNILNTCEKNIIRGKLYVVATPIGNMEDITLRALNILRTVDLIAAEDTRNTRKLLAYHHIRIPLISCHAHNEAQRISGLIEKLRQGKSIALVSDAGTPGISDPGYHLIKAVIANDIKLVPIPGASAVITAVSVAGLPTDEFLFVGFPAKKQGKQRSQLRGLANESRTLVFYESPGRICDLLREIKEIMGDRLGMLGREMTKHHEEFIRGSLSEIFLSLKERPTVKGECTLLVMGCEGKQDIPSEILRDELEEGLKKGERVSELSRQIAEKYNLPKKNVYDQALQIKRFISEGQPHMC